MTVAIHKPSDSWLDALTKLVPGEVIVTFTAALQIDGVGSSRTAQLVVLAFLAPFAALVPYLSTRNTDLVVHPLQYVVRATAFALYALASAPALMLWVGDLHWLAGVGALVIALLASFVISPPGQPRDRSGRSRGTSGASHNFT